MDRTSGYVWVFATTHTVFYHLTLSREADFLHELLRGYEGVIVTDFFPGYESLPVKKQKCLIHLIRDMNDDLFKNPFDEEYRILVSHFNKLLKAIVETIDKHGLKKRHLQKHIRDSERFYKDCLHSGYKSEIANSYVKRIKKNWEHLWLFLHHNNIPWNNNNAEAAIKAFALYRRGINGQVSEAGMNHYLPMLSIAQTCRYRNISFLDFLRSKKGLWQNVKADVLPDYLPFNQARLYVHQAKLKNKEGWNQWLVRKKCPSFIPNDPITSYSNSGWISWEDWLG